MHGSTDIGEHISVRFCEVCCNFKVKLSVKSFAGSAKKCGRYKHCLKSQQLSSDYKVVCSVLILDVQDLFVHAVNILSKS